MTRHSDIFEKESLDKKGNVPEEIAVDETGGERGDAPTRQYTDSHTGNSSNAISDIKSYDEANVASTPPHRGIPPSSAAVPTKSPTFFGEKRSSVTTDADQRVDETTNVVVISSDVRQGQPRHATAQGEQTLKPTPSKTRSNFRLPTMSKSHSSSDSTVRPSTGVEATHPSEPGQKVIPNGACGTAVAQAKSTHEASQRIRISPSKPVPGLKPVTKEAKMIVLSQVGDVRGAEEWTRQPKLNPPGRSDSSNTSQNMSVNLVNETSVHPIPDGYEDSRWTSLTTAKDDDDLITTNGTHGVPKDTFPTSRNNALGTMRSKKSAEDERISKQLRPSRPSHDHVKKKRRALRQRECHKEGPEVAESDKLLQPLAQMIDDYYLVGDEGPVEENWPSTYPIRQVSEVMAKQTKLPEKMSLMIHQISPRIVGGLQDRVHVKKIACSCNVKRRSPGSRSACLKLSCECFAMGEYCNENCKCCASCCNSASESNVQPRTEAIVEALRKDPSSFRHAHAKIAQLQKDRRVQLLKLDTKPFKPQHQSTRRFQKENPQLFPQAEILTTQLQPSYYAVPLKVDGGSTVLTGLSFSLTHPRNRKSDQSTKTEKAAALFTQTDSSIAQAKPANVVETQFQKYWKCETERMSAFFQVMRAHDNTSQKPWSWFPFEQTQKEAAASYATINNDIECVKAVVAAAKMDIMARFYKKSRQKRGYMTDSTDITLPESNKRSKDKNPEDDQILCHEEMECNEESISTVGESEIKSMSIFVAQDTALLQETSRIVRRMARELCERRMNTKSIADESRHSVI